MRDLNTPIQYIKGVGPQRSKVLGRLGIETVSDMLYYLPFRYEDRSNFTSIAALKPGAVATVKGEVKAAGGIRTKKGLDIFQLALDDGTGIIYGVWFNQPYLRKLFKTGQRIIMYGKADKRDKLQMSHPQYEMLRPDEEDASIHVGRIVPMYHLTQSLAHRYLRTIAYRTLSEYARCAPEMLPVKIRARNRLVDINFSLHNIHFPSSDENLKRAYRRIVFDEFFLLQLAIALKKSSVESADGVSHIIKTTDAKDFIRNLSFALTEGQRRAIIEIENDMKLQRPMNRLIQGDVGSGKTVLAAYALLVTIKNGYQGALMAPTEILAEQHFVTLNDILMTYNVNTTLLIHGMSAKTKREAIEDIKDARADIVVGTHALIQEGVNFKNLGLVVIDEQHKFGVSQRARLHRPVRSSASNGAGGQRTPDTLLMTATPIPRTLALTVYGDLDITVIKDMPPGRGDITTYWVSDTRRERVYNFLREEIAKGRQAYIVYPRLEEGSSGGVRAAKIMHEELKEGIFKETKVELIHGRMSSKEKESVMKRFKSGDINILVSTVVIEVGIDVPNASLMVIENAERFGLSQLHQLRGRIGRGPYESYCILISDTESEDARQRLAAIAEAQDGFEIAEEDLKLRGPGDIFGTKQHGLPEIKFGDVVRDMEIMELARKEAFALAAGDPELKAYENRYIRENLQRRFKGRLSFVRVG